MFPLGVDIGGTTIKAAVWRNGRAEQVPVPGAGTRPTPQAEAKLLRTVLAGLPRASRIALAHPAAWGPHRCAEFRAASDLDDVLLLPAPVAAVYHVAGRQPVDLLTAVLDIGSSTSTATVVRGTGTIPELVGDAYEMGIGGIDLDAVLREHVLQVVGADRLDLGDPLLEAALLGLHHEVAAAREALSERTEVVVAVRLPGIQRDVELTRTLLQSLARPVVSRAVSALAEAVDAAGVPPDQVSSVLLIGGAARMPMVADVVAADLGLPVTAGVHAACLGAARVVSSEAAWTDPGLRALPPVVVGVAPVPVVTPPPRAPMVAVARAAVPENFVTVRTGGGGNRTGPVVVMVLVVLVLFLLWYFTQQ